MTEGTKAKVLYGAEFLDFCAAVRARGQYVRSVDVVGKGYRVRDVHKMTMNDHKTTRRQNHKTEVRCPVVRGPVVPAAIAQLWFERMKKECGCV